MKGKRIGPMVKIEFFPTYGVGWGLLFKIFGVGMVLIRGWEI